MSFKRPAVLLLCGAALWLAACEAPAPTPAPVSDQGHGVSDAERQALFERGRADAERKSRLTPRARRFDGDSL